MASIIEEQVELGMALGLLSALSILDDLGDEEIEYTEVDSEEVVQDA